MRIAENGGEEVVEIVRDAAREHPETFQLLHVEQLAFEIVPLAFRQSAIGQIHAEE